MDRFRYYSRDFKYLLRVRLRKGFALRAAIYVAADAATKKITVDNSRDGLRAKVALAS